MTKVSNIKKFWKEFDSVGIHNDKRSSKELPTSILKEDGSMSSGFDETLMTWINHFDTLLNLNSTESSYTATQPGDNCLAIHDDALNRLIELEEVQLAIALLQENKAPGPDIYALAYLRTTESCSISTNYCGDALRQVLYPQHG